MTARQSSASRTGRNELARSTGGRLASIGGKITGTCCTIAMVIYNQPNRGVRSVVV
jgi:hypothetical protein